MYLRALLMHCGVHPLSLTSATYGAVWGTSPDWIAGCSRAQTPRNQDRGSNACLDPPCLAKQLAGFDEVPQPGLSARAKEKPRRRWGQRGAFNGRFALGWVRPGHRTERRGQDDTPKRKMVRARLPSIAKRLIQFECGADATVQFRGAIASRRQPTSPRPAPNGFTRSSTTATGSWPVAIPWASG